MISLYEKDVSSMFMINSYEKDLSTNQLSIITYFKNRLKVIEVKNINIFL